jgi:DNA-binding transcriptional ArsR family regulator
MKRYKYVKITPEKLQEMKKLREEGLKYTEIAETFKVSSSTVRYHLNPKYHDCALNNAKKRYKGYSREVYLKNKEKQKEYYKRRYHSDEEFRKRMIGYVIKYNKKIKEQTNEKA